MAAYFDYGKMTDEGCIDMWLDMAYSWSIPNEEHDLRRNRAEAPMPFLVGPKSIVDIYSRSFGVPPSKMGILLPWFGASYECLPGLGGTAYGGCPTVKKVGGPGYSNIVVDYLPNATAPPYINGSLVTKVLNYKKDPKNTTGTVYQLWYDDPETLARKYSAIKGAGVAAVGMWTADNAGSNVLTAESMWEAVPPSAKHVTHN